ncbi:hypothetical protein PTSG_03350 [Salpingoeca rosetta]|uniref:non-specific serine/threonine protein kinase n=1 Tax=Salpingoeca rosetta (strain ATCC 50818 / BSB-021) TaxID=946362 RepID=F2U4X3_SALR5|nr:uncharacterized protein PTSG_03350 [Salpingoeca rosetta]EGD82689.1 hypothetical protein PTSG_03350 [Salpingoeca rosetta]|eukprot:XP_004995925.1 hypothetical protein PTSG_03350 [Salpingoeca rosetta]
MMGGTTSREAEEAGYAVDGPSIGVPISFDGITSLIDASATGDLECVETLVAEFAPANRHVDDEKDSECDGTALYWASRNGHEAVVRFLLEKGAHVNNTDKEGFTPLWIAGFYGHEAVARFLVEKGADVNQADNDGWTPLWIASQNGHEAVARLLVEKGADVNQAHKNGFTPLYVASQKGHEAVARFLVEKGADVNQADKEFGWTPLWIAGRNGHGAVARFLVEKGADVNRPTNNGWTPLHVASFKNHPDVVRCLLHSGADPTVKHPGTGMTPLDLARDEGHDAVVAILSDPQAAMEPPADPAAPAHDGPADAQQERKAEVMAAMHQIAQHSDTQMAGRAKLMLVGEGRAGKTTTLHSLMGDEFNKDEPSTFGADSMDLSVIVESIDVFNWQHLAGGLSEYMRTLLGTALARTSGMDAAMKEVMTAAMEAHQQRITQQQQLVVGEDIDAEDTNESTQHFSQSSVPKKTQPTSTSTQGDEHHFSSSSSPKPKQSQQQQQQHSASVTTSANGPRPSVSAEAMEKAIKEFNVDAVMGEGKSRVTFKVFDLGGQSTFYLFHPFFLTKYAVYLLVFSMEDLLHQDESKRDEAWEFMEHWLSSLHLHAKGAPVLIIGTFADVVSKRKQHENISRDIHSRLRHNPAFPGVVHNDKHGLWFWPVDNTQSINDTMIQDLRQTISSTALAQEYVSQEVAVPYLHLYDKLHAIARDEKRPLLTFDDVVDIARTCGLRTRQETKACLQFLHLYSMVLYYDHVPGMENYVILSPQWAVDTMTRVIRNFDLHRDERDWEARAVGAQLWDDLVDRGILHRRLLEVLWKDVRDDLIEPFLQLMMEYGLCMDYTPPRSAESSDSSSDNSVHHDDEQQREHQQYLVPAILPMVLDTPSDLPSSVTLSVCAAHHVHKYAGHEASTAYISFRLTTRASDGHVSAKDMQRASFLPEGLFTMVLAHVLRYIQPNTLSTPLLSRTHVVVFVGEAEVDLQLVPAVGGIKIQITSERPRTLLHVLYDIITTAALQRYPDLKANLLLPYNKKTLLFFEDVHRHHTNKKALRAGRSQLLSPEDLIAKYGPLLPVLGLQDKYDAFISYRQRGNTGLVLTLHPRLEHHGLVVFVDANNLEAGVNFKHACMAALQHSVVACPVVSVAAIHQMRSLGLTDVCDNVLLEWMAMLELLQLAHQHQDKIRLRRIVPLFVGSGWHDSSHAMSVASAGEYDSPEYMKRLATKLPDVVSTETAAALDQYFTQVLHLRPPQQHKSVREVVLSLFDMDGVMSLHHHVARAADAVRMAERVRTVVAAAKDDFEEWLSSLSLSADARGALAALEVTSFEVLRAMKQRGCLTEEALTGVPVGAAARLIHAFETGTQASAEASLA